MAQSPSRTVYLGQLAYAEKERFLDFLVANKIEFVAEDNRYVATVQVVPPESQSSRIGGRVSSPKSQSKAPAAGPGDGRSRSAEPKVSNNRSASSIVPQAGVKNPQATRRAAQTCLRKRYQRFCNLLPPLTQVLKKVQDTAMMRFAEDLYEARYDEESEYLKKKAQGLEVESLSRFPDSFYEFARKRFGLKAMVCSNCWAMVSSLELRRGGNIHIETFGRFLDESFDTEDLSFFLFLRAELEEAISKLPRRGQSSTGDVDERDVDFGKMAAAREKKSRQTNRKKMIFQVRSVNSSTCHEALKSALRRVHPDKKGLINPMFARISNVINAGNRNLPEELRDPNPGIDPIRILQMATEEYHKSRDIEEPEKDPDDLFNKILSSQQDPKEYKPNIPTNLRELDSAVRKEVKQVTKGLIEGLVASGKSEINQQKILEWALNIVIRRHERGEFADRDPVDIDYSMDLDEMMEAVEDLHLDPNSPHFSTGHYEVVLDMDPEEFELHFEDNIRQLLLYALEQTVGDIIDQISGAFFDARSRSGARTKIAVNLAPMADSMMESVISKDYKRWIKSLRLHRSQNKDKKSVSQSSRLRQTFAKLHEEFQGVVAQSPVTPYNIHRMCRSIVSVEEMANLIRARAGQLSRDPTAELSDTEVGNDDEGSDQEHR